MKKILTLFFLVLLTFNVKSQTWYPLGSGLVGNDPFYDRVNTLTTDSIHNRMWAGGSFQIAGGDSISDLAYWNGSNWFPLTYINSQNDTVEYQFIAEVSSSIMFHGKFLFAAAPNPLYWFDRWRLYSYDAASLSLTVIGTFDNRINTMEIYEDTLYVAGTFSDYQPFTSGNPNISLNGIAKWNETDFVPVGQAIDGGEMNALCIYNGNLIIGGFFEYIDGTYCKNIAKWDGSQWGPIGNGIGTASEFDVIIFSLESYHNKLYAGGNIDWSYFSNELAVWDGTNWSGASSSFSIVDGLEVIKNKLFVGTSTALQFWQSGTPWYYCVAEFNDATWLGTGKGPIQTSYQVVKSFTLWNDSIYVGGEFKLMSDSPYVYAGFVARFDPTLLPTNLNATICAKESYNFNGLLLNSSGVYTDTLISVFGEDSIVVLTLSVNEVDISISNDTLIATGSGIIQWMDCNTGNLVSGTGNIFIPQFAGSYAAIITNMPCKDTTDCVFYDGVQQLTGDISQVKIYPNPSNGSFTLVSNEFKGQDFELEIFDLLSAMVYKKEINSFTGYLNLNLADKISNGQYIVRLKAKNKTETTKLIINETN